MYNLMHLGVEVTTQMVPIPQSVLDIPGRDSLATQELVFKADSVPAFGFKSYYVEKLAAHLTAPAAVKNKFNIGNAVSLHKNKS
jgi:lysosomal alpha-mannosidase